MCFVVIMAVSSATEEKPGTCFTNYVDATTVSLKSDTLVCSHLMSASELELLVKSPKDMSKVKKLVRSSDWPVNHDIRRSLWVTLCSTDDSFTDAADGYSYYEMVQQLFGAGMVYVY